MHKNYIKISLVALAFLPSLVCGVDTVELDVIEVEDKKSQYDEKKKNEVTGLGKVVKDSAMLEKQMVTNIRDLTTYDPGISVVEQGQGGSAGYSIRGVDKNRVSITVDGMPQIQSYIDPTSYKASGGSGAMNEIEFENVSEVEITKGSNSAQSGSGALGGSVNYRTKDVRDLIMGDKNWGLVSKTSYDSKSKRYGQTLGAAAMYNGFEGMLQYTKRAGKEIHIHPAAYKDKVYSVEQLGYYENKYRLHPDKDKRGKTNEDYYKGQKVSPTEFYADENGKLLTQTRTTWSKKQLDKLRGKLEGKITPEEEQQLKSMVHPVKKIKGKDYTGEDRIAPNPMDYKSDSVLVRFGYKLKDRNDYVGVILEKTTQTYDIRDMSVPTYYLPYEYARLTGRNCTFYSGDALKECRRLENKYLSYPITNEDATGSSALPKGYYTNNPMVGAAPHAAWARTHYIDEKHVKQRQGFVYKYNDAPWADLFEFNIDRQTISLVTDDKKLGCDKDGNKNCRASVDKIGSWERIKKTKYKEEHARAALKWGKWYDLGVTTHDIQITAGVDHYEASHEKMKDVSRKAIDKNGKIVDKNGKKVYVPNGVLIGKDYCVPGASFKNPRCKPVIIKGNNQYASLRDNLTFGQYIDFGVSGRYDINTIKSSDTLIRNKKFINWSLAAGLVVRPTEYIDLSYRVSNGFRVPSFQESFGNIGVAGNEGYVSNLDPEKSLNKEIGLTLHGYAGYLEFAYFTTKYKNIIAHAAPTDEQGVPITGSNGLYNALDVKIKGINIQGMLDLNSLYYKIPQGLSVHAAYSKSKPVSSVVKPHFVHVRSYALDTIQPAKYVLGLNYDSPTKKWGVGSVLTVSKAKNPNELKSSYGNYKFDVAKQTTKGWRTVDFTGYWNITKNFSIRAGVYNAFNYKYLTWEAVRQTSFEGAHQHDQYGDYAKYAAPGRNFRLSFEAKF